MARAVVDVEYSNNFKEVPGLSNWASDPMAQLGKRGLCGPVQVDEGTDKHVGQATPHLLVLGVQKVM